MRGALHIFCSVSLLASESHGRARCRCCEAAGDSCMLLFSSIPKCPMFDATLETGIHNADVMSLLATSLQCGGMLLQFLLSTSTIGARAGAQPWTSRQGARALSLRRSNLPKLLSLWLCISSRDTTDVRTALSVILSSQIQGQFALLKLASTVLQQLGAQPHVSPRLCAAMKVLQPVLAGDCSIRGGLGMPFTALAACVGSIDLLSVAWRTALSSLQGQRRNSLSAPMGPLLAVSGQVLAGTIATEAARVALEEACSASSSHTFSLSRSTSGGGRRRQDASTGAASTRPLRVSLTPNTSSGFARVRHSSVSGAATTGISSDS